jgi:hypothetical protein
MTELNAQEAGVLLELLASYADCVEAGSEDKERFGSPLARRAIDHLWSVSGGASEYAVNVLNLGGES